jgi:hypothetical protein
MVRADVLGAFAMNRAVIAQRHVLRISIVQTVRPGEQLLGF